jgi:hypothetical protein
MTKIETVAEAVAKSTPPVTVSVLSLGGIPLSEWVYILTIVWVCWQLGCSIFDRWEKYRGRK